MRRNLSLLFLLILSVVGCSKQDDSEAPPASEQPPSSEQPKTSESSGALPAGPFSVTLSTDPTTPKVGKTRFIASLSRDGKAVTDAKVTLSLAMPSMKMKGPQVSLESSEGGTYVGTADLSMAGPWEATVTIAAQGESGTAVHQFNAGP